MFAGTAWVLRQLYPGSVLLEQRLDNIESMLVIATVGALGIMFVIELLKLIAEAARSAWKGFLHGAQLFAT